MSAFSVIFGAVVGISLGLTGGGGAIFAVPLLVYGLGVPAREAVGVSLVSVGLTSLTGFLRKWHKGEAELPTGLMFAAAGMLGAPIGNWLASLLPESVLMLLLAGLMLTIAGRMWSQGRRPAQQTLACLPVESSAVQSADYRADRPGCQRDAAGRLILNTRCALLLLLAGLGAGILSGLLGVGGGFIIVPALMLFSRMSMSHAVGTSLMVISLVSASGVASQLLSGQQIPAAVTALFVLGGLIGLWLGQSVGQRLPVSVLQQTFAVSILLVAIFVIFKNLLHHESPPSQHKTHSTSAPEQVLISDVFPPLAGPAGQLPLSERLL